MFWIPKTRWQFAIWHSTALVMLALAGCGGVGGSSFGGQQRYAVKGKVLLADGQPVTVGRVIFISDAPPASAAADIGGDGTFEFKSPSGDGLPAATYKVHVTSAPPTGNRTAVAKPAFAAKYLDEENSGLTATVTADESKNQFEFKLEANSAKGTASSPGGRR